MKVLSSARERTFVPESRLRSIRFGKVRVRVQGVTLTDDRRQTGVQLRYRGNNSVEESGRKKRRCGTRKSEHVVVGVVVVICE